MKFAKELSRRSAEWVAKGLVSKDQAEALIKHEEALERQTASSNLGKIIGALGAVLLGFSALSFVAAHWQGMPDAVRSPLVFGVFALVLWVAFKFSNEARNNMAEALFVLSVLLFGANIGLQAQIFHIPARGNDGVLLWFAGALAISWGGRSGWAAMGAMLIGSAWGALEFTGPDGFRLLRYATDAKPWYGSGVALGHLCMWVLSAIPLFRFSTSRNLKILAADIFAIGLAALLLDSLSWSAKNEAVMLPTFALWSIMLYLVAKTLGPRFEDADHFAFSGARLSLILMFALTFPALTRPMANQSEGTTILQISAWICLGLLVFVASKLSDRTRRQLTGYAIVGSWAVLFGFLHPPTVSGTTFFVAANLLFGATLLWGIQTAVIEANRRLVNMVFLVFFIWAGARYFDLFGSLLDRSLFFLTGGALMFFLAWFLNKQRRNVAQKMEVENK